MREQIINEYGLEVYQFLTRYIDVIDKKSLIIATTTLFNIDRLPGETYQNIVNLKRINDIQRINKFFELVNSKLPHAGSFIGCAETKYLRKKRILKKYIPVLNWILYFFDYLIKRVFPKFLLTKKLYFFLTRGQNRVITRAEVLGRLYSCGFEVKKEMYINKNLFFVAQKVKEPAFDMEPSYGPLVKLKRVGKNGNLIKVYKMRTMHPYAEYIQDYVYRKNDLKNGGKFNNDFRVSTVGRIMRKLWIDELPMLINLVKGDLKLFGVRPISEHYFYLYPEALRKKRIKYKPGLIPPFYADLPDTLDEIVESEMNYLNAYQKHPFKTNTRYFFKAMYNILFRKARSC